MKRNTNPPGIPDKHKSEGQRPVKVPTSAPADTTAPATTTAKENKPADAPAATAKPK